MFYFLLLAVCVSIDSLGIGITYGLRNTKISSYAKWILFLISFAITSFSLLIGSFISSFLPTYIANGLGPILLCLMGFWIILQSTYIEKKEQKPKKEKTIYQCFIRFLGITIQIIRDPNHSDLDHSNQIDSKEAFYLGVALSLDSIGIGITSSIIGFSSVLFPVLVATFQFIFLTIGSILGNKIKEVSHLPENIWSLFSGILLICIGLAKLLF